MGFKKTWAATKGITATVFINRYAEKVSTGSSYGVRRVMVIETGPEAGREIETFLTPARARCLAEDLIRHADRAEGMNRGNGYVDPQEPDCTGCGLRPEGCVCVGGVRD